MDAAFIYMILEIVNEIPEGKVSCYSDIAIRSGHPRNARLVGKILGMAEYWGNYPCHRVVHADGKLVNGWNEQASLLQAEGVIVTNNRIDMAKYRDL